MAWGCTAYSRDANRDVPRRVPATSQLALRLLAILVMLSAISAFAADTPTTRPAGRFTTVDVVIDSADKPLAAWQVELKATSGNVKIVGVEGGDHRNVYRDPPYYDPAALAGGRIILASFTTGDTAPKGRIIVARVHLQSDGEYQLVASTTAAADTAAKPIEVKASVTPHKERE